MTAGGGGACDGGIRCCAGTRWFGEGIKRAGFTTSLLEFTMFKESSAFSGTPDEEATE